MKKVLNNFIKKYYRLILQCIFIFSLIFKFDFGIIIWGIMLIATVFLGRVYCGFCCTYGIYQDWIGVLGRKIFKSKFDTLIPEKLHNILGYLRYVTIIVWLFFATSFFATKVLALIGGPSPNVLINIIFSREVVTTATIASLVIFTIMSLIVSRPYCKYLCHGSVQAGALSFAKLVKLERNPNKCVKCGRCEKVCPMKVPITRLEKICTNNCVACYQCVHACPKKDALYLNTQPLKKIFGISKHKVPKEIPNKDEVIV